MLANVTPVWIWYSLSNMRQLYIFFNSGKTWRLIVCWFLCFYKFLHIFTCCEPKIVFLLNQVKTGKTQKSTHNQSSRFGSIDKNMELSCIYLDVQLFSLTKFEQESILSGISMAFCSWKILYRAGWCNIVQLHTALFLQICFTGK